LENKMEKEKQGVKSGPNHFLGCLGYGFILAMLLTYAFCLRKEIGRDVSKYIVTDKVDKKISYRSLSQPYDMHVMTFYGDTAEMAPGYYPFIKVGDTITGRPREMSKPVVKSQIIKPRIGMKTVKSYVIDAVNGKKLDELKEIALRDSMIYNMKHRQR